MKNQNLVLIGIVILIGFLLFKGGGFLGTVISGPVTSCANCPFGADCTLYSKPSTTYGTTFCLATTLADKQTCINGGSTFYKDCCNEEVDYCSGNILHFCGSGEWYTVDCNAQGQGCDPATASCKLGTLPTPVSCSDSDGGKTYNTKGTATVTYSDNSVDTATDYCSSSSYVMENYCKSDKTIAAEQVYCSNGCSNGACLSSTCTDTDNGKNYNVKGTVTVTVGGTSDSVSDYCVDNKNVAEYYCSGTEASLESYTCPGSCSNGICSGAAQCGNGICEVSEVAIPSLPGYCPQDCCGCDGDGVCEANYGEGVAPNCCTQDCPLITCGNNVLNSGEACDGTNLGGYTCQTLNTKQGWSGITFTGGTLKCHSNCIYDISSCTGEVVQKSSSLTQEEWNNAILYHEWSTISDSSCDLSSQCQEKAGYNVTCIKSLEVWEQNYQAYINSDCAKIVRRLNFIIPNKFIDIDCSVIGWLYEKKDSLPRGTCTLSGGGIKVCDENSFLVKIGRMLSKGTDCDKAYMYGILVIVALVFLFFAIIGGKR